jgi:hypothetical protein
MIKRLDTNKQKRAVIAQSALGLVPLRLADILFVDPFVHVVNLISSIWPFGPASTAHAMATPGGPQQKMIFHLALRVQQPSVAIRRAPNN